MSPGFRKIEPRTHELPVAKFGKVLLHEKIIWFAGRRAFCDARVPCYPLASPFISARRNTSPSSARPRPAPRWARQAFPRWPCASPAFSENDLDKIWPIIEEGQSDTASFDNALELLVQGGYSIAEAMLIMVPEAWQNNEIIDTCLLYTSDAADE